MTILTRPTHRSLLACVAVLAGLCAIAPAASARTVDRGRVEAADLTAERATERIRDEILKGRRARGLRARAAQAGVRTERFVDPHGHSILIRTGAPTADLRRIASILAGTLHGRELSALRVTAVSLSEVGSACGGGKDAEGIIACYAPDDENRLASGQMVVPYDYEGLAHAVVHEYGHHVDNQLWNLTPLGLCGVSSDGSRRWFFARQVADNVVSNTDCTADTRWDRLLGELYAEDYVRLNGIDDWVLPSLRRPTPAVLAALRADIVTPFLPSRRAYRGRASGGRRTSRRVAVRTHTFLTATLAGPAGANLDVLVTRRGGSRVLGRSRGRGSRERLRVVLEPGTYDVKVASRRGGGSYRLSLALE